MLPSTTPISKKNGKVRTLIVGDNVNLRQLLRYNLEQQFPMMVVEEMEASRIMGKVYAFSPDLIFLDIRLPGGIGLDLTERIRKNYPKAVIVLLARHDLPEYHYGTIQNGVNYFLPKRASTFDDITALVRSISSNSVL
jgi:DNA-binding NarL/FixJ family response regulator